MIKFKIRVFTLLCHIAKSRKKRLFFNCGGNFRGPSLWNENSKNLKGDNDVNQIRITPKTYRHCDDHVSGVDFQISTPSLPDEQPGAAIPGIVRIAGADCYATAVEIVKENFPQQAISELGVKKTFLIGWAKSASPIGPRPDNGKLCVGRRCRYT